MLKVTVWNEYYGEKTNEEAKQTYPQGIHSVLASFLQESDIEVRTTTLLNEQSEIQPDGGLPQLLLEDTDVLIWWGHCKHEAVPDETAQRVQQAVQAGMGIIFLHSAHKSKPFMGLMGTTGNLLWREAHEKERLWVVDSSHPIAQGIGSYVEIPHEEMYGEAFDIPTPDELVFIGWFQGGNVFRSGCCWKRGCGRVFYFQPGHESYPVYYQPEIQTIIKNAVKWATPTVRLSELKCHKSEALEKM